MDLIAIFENYKTPDLGSWMPCGPRRAGQGGYGHVLLRAFWRAMHEINIKALAENDLIILCKAYCDTDPGL